MHALHPVARERIACSSVGAYLGQSMASCNLRHQHAQPHPISMRYQSSHCNIRTHTQRASPWITAFCHAAADSQTRCLLGSAPSGHTLEKRHAVAYHKCCHGRQPFGARGARDEGGAQQGAAAADFCRATFACAAAAHCRKGAPLAAMQASRREGFDAEVVVVRCCRSRCGLRSWLLLSILLHIYLKSHVE